MHRTEADGATIDNRYTEGNASLSIAATAVSSQAANSWQEEIAGVVEEAGITLLSESDDTYDQLKEAIKTLIQNGGSVSPNVFTIANDTLNQDVQESGVDLEFDRTIVKAVSFDFVIIRNTDSSAVKSHGILRVIYEPKNSAWDISVSSAFDSSGVVFKLATGSTPDKVKLQIDSDDITGTSYFGELTLTNKKEVRI